MKAVHRNEEYIVVSDKGKLWSRNTVKGSKGLADYLAARGEGGQVYTKAGWELKNQGEDVMPLYQGNSYLYHNREGQ